MRGRGYGASGRLLAETSRVEAFSDGVLAIAITLLMLDLLGQRSADGREPASEPPCPRNGMGP